MRIAALLLLSIALPACQQKTGGDAVREAYENRAVAIEAKAAAQPTETARKIYKARADALREEGRDREKGLEGGTPSKGFDAGQNGETTSQ